MVLKDRLEEINQRLLNQKSKAEEHAFKQQLKLQNIDRAMHNAHLKLEGSSTYQEEAVKAYTNLFPEGNMIEIGSVPIRPCKSTIGFSTIQTRNFGAGGMTHGSKANSFADQSHDFKSSKFNEQKIIDTGKSQDGGAKNSAR